MNKVILSGNLCKDIEMRETANGKAVVMNSVAVQRDYKNEQGGYDTDFINIVVWGQSAEYLKKYAAKGDRVELVGRWTVRKYEDKDGYTRQVNECVVESIKAFSKQDKKQEEKQDEKPYLTELSEEDEDGLPF